MQVVISGITGFIGSHLACHLIRKYHDIKIVGLSRKLIQEPNDLSQHQIISCRFHKLTEEQFLKQVVHIQFNLADPKPLPGTLRNFHCFFHAAAQINESPGLKALEDINVNGTKWLLREIERLQIKSHLYFSSVAAHDERNLHRPYFSTKCAAEFLVEQSHNYNIVIPAMVIGAGDLLKNTRKKLKIYIQFPIPFVPATMINITDVHELCQVSIELGLSGKFGNKYFICPHQVSLQKFYSLYRRHSIWKHFPLWKSPKIRLFSLFKKTNQQRIYQDDLPDNLRSTPQTDLDSLVKESCLFRP